MYTSYHSNAVKAGNDANNGQETEVIIVMNNSSSSSFRFQLSEKGFLCPAAPLMLNILSTNNTIPENHISCQGK